MQDLARIANLSVRQFARAFKAHTGVTPARYHGLLRLELARALVHDPRLTVEQIAEHCGFADARHLRRVWRERLGRSISETRAALKGPPP